jgi:hypothetical protein
MKFSFLNWRLDESHPVHLALQSEVRTGVLMDAIRNGTSLACLVEREGKSGIIFRSYKYQTVNEKQWLRMERYDEDLPMVARTNTPPKDPEMHTIPGLNVKETYDGSKTMVMAQATGRQAVARKGRKGGGSGGRWRGRRQGRR